MSQQAVALIIGAGDATGGAIAKRFAREGYLACLVRRSGDKLVPLVEEIEKAGGTARGFGCDARDEEAVINLFAEVEESVGPIEVVVFNPGANVNFPIRETTSRVYRKVWEMACFAGFLVGREAARHMVPRNRGTILFTGATASVRGGKGFSAFSGAKHALRALAQSMARELGAEGIHVAHVVIDGAIDSAFIREMFGDALEKRGPDAMLAPDDIAETYWNIHAQRRSAWTFETDLRPWLEPW
ncbi:MAG: SDR family oxidoreductase [Deltaproteobacteria bacterium]|nr:SDR family oxidoreductase [Deltaproteobacteria bacterium]MBW2390578.1 SDR family oxidoreductase [Deltaproteobacteria bacterium]